jgi:DIS3-like exonuclease 1
MHSKEAVGMMAVVAEMMISANSAVAERLVESYPGASLLRRHPPPRTDAFQEVRFIF